jgi:cell division inhibitor SulA
MNEALNESPRQTVFQAPQGALTELPHTQPGLDEDLVPVLARLSRQGKWVALIAPPFMPSAAALAARGVDLSRLLVIRPRERVDALGALERALRAGTCGAVLAWPKQIDERARRRLQLAAEAGRTWGMLFRGQAAQPAAQAPAATVVERPRLAIVASETPAPAAACRPARPLGRRRQIRPLQRPSPQLDLPLVPHPAVPRPQPGSRALWPRR